jgi:hypothetical protein
MFFYFFNYQNKLTEKKYIKAFLNKNFSENFNKWYFLIKFNQRQTALCPKINSWFLRSLYTKKSHFAVKNRVKKAIFMHLFWMLDVWQLAHPLSLKGISTHFPIFFQQKCSNSLEIYSLMQDWVLNFGLNQKKMLPYKVTSGWLDFKPNLWMTRPYSDFLNWCHKGKKFLLYRREQPLLWFLNRWYLENGFYHKNQARLLCSVPSHLPTSYTKVLWLRLLQYPSLYNYQWYPMLKHLNAYESKTVLPWELLYTSKQLWMFNEKALGLSQLVNALVKQQRYIVEYVLIKCWKDLLKSTDDFSRTFQLLNRNFLKKKINK